MEPDFDDRRRLSARSDRRLAVCDCCGRDFVVVTAAEEFGHAGWRLTLRCGDCEMTSEVIASEVELDAYYDEFTEAMEWIEADVMLLAQERMADEVSCLVVALRLGLIGWDDLAR
jgi:hypothetical protein